jgi:NADPH2:quinone reductase
MTLHPREEFTMKAAYIEQTGPPDVIQYGELPQPQIGPGQALVKIGAVAVNPIDTYIRNGANYWPLPKQFIIGADFAGEVVQVGADVKDLKVGERVWGSRVALPSLQPLMRTYSIQRRRK